MLFTTTGHYAPTGGDDEPFKSKVMTEVTAAFAEIGYDANPRRLVEPKPGTKAANGGYALSADIPEVVSEVRENGLSFLSVNPDMDGYFGESRGSSNVTTAFVKDGLTVTDVLTALSDPETAGGDQITKALNLIELMWPAGENPTESHITDVLAYFVWEYALGWYAERILAGHPDFKKGSTSQDKGGGDLWHNGVLKQLKTLAHFASNNGNFGDKKYPHMFYEFVGNELVVAELEEVKGSNQLAGYKKEKLGTGKTEAMKSVNRGVTKDYPRPARVLW